jgi:hypothetical protein
MHMSELLWFSFIAASKDPPAEIYDNSKSPGKEGQSFSPTLNLASLKFP